MKSVSLYYQEGTSDKEYHIQLEQVKDQCVVNFQYGRRGNALQEGTKTETPVSYEQAEKIFDKLLREKEGKGYRSPDGVKISGNGNEKKKPAKDISEVTVKPRTKEVHIAPQLLNDIDNPQYYIENDDYLAQPKKDGERRLLEAGERIRGFNKKGQEVPLNQAIVKSNTNICILDGEIIGEKLHIFDILSHNGKSITEMACMSRVLLLNSLEFGDGIEIVPTATSKEGKQKMYDDLKKNNAEGIVFKLKNAPYKAGRPNSGGDHLKHKFYKEATFIVASLTKGKRSVGLELIGERGERVGVGKVTIPPNKEVPKVGDFVEVKYLYAYRGGAIFQSEYKWKRDDCDLTDATTKQLVYKAEVEA